MRYLLDTNICIYVAKRKPAGVASRMRALRPGDVGMSVITYLELVYGACKSERHAENLAVIEQLRGIIPVQPLDDSVAKHYGLLRTALERRGSPIGPYDLIIAAHALSRGLTLVTNNVKEFSRVDGLRLENWAA
ncbi:MAG: type II toxin-antitoxin system VapC family toxin [Acidobacteria bacterium]|nr:type II toxin-antitoxin system VapC family toxin [Acidobacteriota bacterium]MBI3470082.1 type II toxin-antitoxin system VapC family toxin [Candidatus Solibacter usitatus]